MFTKKELFMKSLFLLLIGLLMLNISACNQSSDEVTIERQEDYESKDARESRNLSVETDDEIEVDRDILSDDEIEIDD